MHLHCVYCKGSGIDDADGGECEPCAGDGRARCERRHCAALGLILDDNGEALCRECFSVCAECGNDRDTLPGGHVCGGVEIDANPFADDR